MLTKEASSTPCILATRQSQKILHYVQDDKYLEYFSPGFRGFFIYI